MLPMFGAAKVLVFLLLAISIIQSRENKMIDEVDGMYNDNYKLYAPDNMIRLARFYAVYDKPFPNENTIETGSIFNKRRDRPRPMRFGK